jgi:hypothetical protein
MEQARAAAQATLDKTSDDVRSARDETTSAASDEKV